MVRISELHESDDDSMERLNLDDYNSDDYDEYLFDNMEATPSAITEGSVTSTPAATSTSRRKPWAMNYRTPVDWRHEGLPWPPVREQGQ